MNKLPAGKYWVGDCCYFINDKIDWVDEFCEPSFKVDDGEPFLIRGIPLASCSTMYGDGSYKSNIGFNFPVDAGIIGVIPLDLAVEDDRSDLGVLVDFTQDFTVSSNNGTITIGHIEVYTNDQDEDNRDDEDWFFSPND